MSIRLKKVESLLQKELSAIIQKHYQHHGLVTVSGVKITPDLSIAKVYLSFLTPGVQADQAFEQMAHHDTDIRYRLASKIRHQMRKVPELHFFHDDSAEQSDHMESLFKKIHEQEESFAEDKRFPSSDSTDD